MALLAYDGAKVNRRTDGWRSFGASSEAEVGTSHKIMRERARELVRNNPHAEKGLSVIVANKVGTGIMCQAAGKNQRANKRMDERWKRWIDNCELSGRLDFYGLQGLVERCRSESGETIIRFVETPMAHPFDVPFRLQVFEPDFIDSNRNETRPNGNEIKYGIEYSARIPVAYWLMDVHPGDIYSSASRGSYVSRRVPAEEVIHFYKPLRAGQTRGITDFATVMLKLRALDDYDDAEVMRKNIAACMAAFVTTPGGLPGSSVGPISTASGEKVETFRPGMVGYLKPGESVIVADPKPSDDYRAFTTVQMHAIAAGLKVPYELLTGDLSEVTYTSHRGGLVQFRGMVEADQWQVIVPQLCQRVCERFAREASGVDALIDPETPWTYTPPRFGLLDPAKEVPAMIDAIKGGVMTYQNTVRREGYDPTEQLDEIEAFQRECERRGIVLTSNPATAPQQITAEKPALAPREVTDEAA